MLDPTKVTVKIEMVEEQTGLRKQHQYNLHQAVFYPGSAPAFHQLCIEGVYELLENAVKKHYGIERIDGKEDDNG